MAGRMRTAALLFLTACASSSAQTAPPPAAAAPAPVAAATPAPAAEPCSSIAAFLAGEALPKDRDAALGVVRSYLTACGRGEIARLTTDLVRFPTVSAEEPPTSGRNFTAL